jgi:hypothetical protein
MYSESLFISQHSYFIGNADATETSDFYDELRHAQSPTKKLIFISGGVAI